MTTIASLKLNMEADTNWLTAQLHQWKDQTPQQVLKELGSLSSAKPAYDDLTVVATKDPELFVLDPHNPRLQQIIVQLDNGLLKMIRLKGGDFSVPFDFVRGLTAEYKRTFNTYDSIDDEQFYFYPSVVGQPFVAIESWVPLADQHEDSTEVNFKSLTFHFSKGQVPYHFRDGWHLATPAA